jgi:hypothetical protein
VNTDLDYHEEQRIESDVPALAAEGG